MLPLASDLEKLKSKLLSACDPKTAAVEAWSVVSGARIAEQTHAISYDGKKLRVMVPNKEWQRELSALAGEYVRKLNGLLPDAVQYVEFITPEETGKNP